MKTCIICRNSKDISKFNKEHIIEDSLGGRLQIGDVCKSCNEKLGSKVDAYLTNNFLSEINRFILNIKGKDGNVPNPFKRGVALNNLGARIILDKNLKPKLEGRVVKGKKENEYLIVASNEKEAFELIRKKIKRQHNRKVTDEEIRNMITECTHNSYNPKIICHESINFEKVRLAILKIAYEFAFYWLGDTYLSDIQGKRIAKILFNAIQGDLYEKIDNMIISTVGIKELDNDNAIKQAISRKFEKDSSEVLLNSVHFVQMYRQGNKLYCYISIFGDFNYSVVVSQRSYEYSLENKRLIFIELADTGEFIFANSCSAIKVGK